MRFPWQRRTCRSKYGCFCSSLQVTYLHTKNEGGLKIFISNFASLSWRIALKCFCAVYTTFPSSFNILCCYQVVQTSHTMRFYFFKRLPVKWNSPAYHQNQLAQVLHLFHFCPKWEKKEKQTNVKTATTLPLINKLWHAVQSTRAATAL